MKPSWARWTALAALMAAIAAAATFAAGAGAATARTGVAASEVAATVETRLVIHHFNAAGNKVVGHGSVLSTYRNAAGATMSTSSRPVKLTVATASGPGPCQILYLELDELDLTLLGLRVFLRSATEGEPIRLTLSADSTHGVLGKLFCDLAGATISTPTTSATAATKKATSNGTLTTLGSNRKTTEKWTAKLAAAQLSKKMHNTTILHAQATVYQPSQAPRQTQGSHSLRSAADDPATDCQVLHLILGPLHLDLLGLIADLNKVALDIFAIPGTTIGDLFCSLTGGAPPATAAPTSP